MTGAPQAPALASSWLPLAWLILSLALLLILERWLNRHLQGFLLLVTGNPDWVMYVNFLLLLPGILLHEFSHWLAAQLLGVHSGGIILFPKKRGARQIHYGSVQIGPADPLRHSLIGLAPLLAGSTAVLLCARYGLQLAPLSSPASWDELLAHLGAPDAPLWLYLIFAISNAMLPSKSDRQPWGPVMLFSAAIALLLLVTGVAAQIPPEITRGVLHGVSYLAYAFSLTVVVDLLAALLIVALENVAGVLLRRRVQY